MCIMCGLQGANQIFSIYDRYGLPPLKVHVPLYKITFLGVKTWYE